MTLVRAYNDGVASPLIHQVLRDLQTKLRIRFGERLERVVLFGSWAREEAHEDSDIDVAVVIDRLTPDEWVEAVAIASDLSARTELPLSPTVMSSEHFRRSVKESGIAVEVLRDGVQA